jgi:hypothetical protein
LPSASTTAAGPLTFEAAAPDGHWIVVCQARTDSDRNGQLEVKVSPRGELTGDALQRYLELVSGDELELEDLLAASADGRFLVLTLAGRAVLYDTTSGTRTDLSLLGADIARDPNQRNLHRTLVFGDGALFYVRKHDREQELVERALTDGAERVLYQSTDPVARITLDARNKLISLAVARDATARNGRFIWPHALESTPKACQSSVPRYVAANPNADLFSYVVVNRESGETRAVDGFVTGFDSGVVRRDAEGALLLDRGKASSVVADKGCSGRLLFTDPWHDTFLVGCTLPKRPGRFGVELVAAGARKPLDIDVAALSWDEPARSETRLLALYPGADSALFDTQTRKLHALHPGDAVLATQAAHALLRRGKTLVLFDAEVDREAALPGELAPFGDVLRQGALVFASPELVDVASGRVLGNVAGKALALSTSGAVLVPAKAATESSLAEGPLSWRVPE